MRLLFSLTVYLLSHSVLQSVAAADGISHDEFALATAFSSRFRTSDDGEADYFLSRYRITAESETLPGFRSDPPRPMVILIR
jgi:hypothetical protein